MTYDFTNLYAERTRLYGSGGDGDVTVSSGITLTRDMSYSNLTLAAGGSIGTRGYRIHVLNVLDLTASGANAIYNAGYAGGNGTDGGSGSTGGSAGSGAVFGALPGASAGQVGGQGGTISADPGENGIAGVHATLGAGGAGGHSGQGANGGPPA